MAIVRSEEDIIVDWDAACIYMILKINENATVLLSISFQHGLVNPVRVKTLVHKT